MKKSSTSSGRRPDVGSGHRSEGWIGVVLRHWTSECDWGWVQWILGFDHERVAS